MSVPVQPRTDLIYPSAIDVVRLVNTNAVTNARSGREGFANLPDLYNLAYAICYETGEIPVAVIFAPAESIGT